eukprot:497761-Pleurochrysis_carterae.AAC.1
MFCARSSRRRLHEQLVHTEPTLHNADSSHFHPHSAHTPPALPAYTPSFLPRPTLDTRARLTTSTPLFPVSPLSSSYRCMPTLSISH